MDTITATRVASRVLLRSSFPRQSTTLHISSRRIPRIRFQSTTSQGSSQNATSHTPAILAGVAGGSVVFLGGYIWYHFSRAKTFVNTAKQTEAYFDSAFKKTTEAAPQPNEAIKWLRNTTQTYAAFIPGAKPYVDSAFDDLDKIHDKHGSEVDSIINDAYDQLKAASKSGVSIETASKAWDILQNTMKKIADLAGDAAEDVLNNHPDLKERLGGRLDELNSIGDAYGPEAKKQVDQTWQQVQDILKGGLGVGSIDQIRRLISEKSEELKKFGDQAWSKGMEQVKPLLDKEPQLKELVEKNKDKLLQGDLSQLWENLKSGNTDDIKNFIQEQTEKASQKAKSGGNGGIESLLNMIPGGSEIMPRLQKLQELSDKHGKEAEKLIKDALSDIQGVLEKKVDEGEKLVEKAKEDAKK